MGQAKQRQAEIAKIKETGKALGLIDITLISNGKTAFKVMVPKQFFSDTSPDFERQAGELLAGTSYFFDGSKDSAQTYSIACAVFLHSQKQPARGAYIIDVLSRGPGQPCAISYRTAE